MRLKLAYSTDLDDAFMFWALASGRLDARAWGFDELSHERSDTRTLNAWAREGTRDVVAVSIAAMPAIAADYLLLPHGGSVGRGYGPVVVAAATTAGIRLGTASAEATRLASLGSPNVALDGARVGVPGEGTTCAVLLALAAPGARRVVVESAPMERAFAALADGTVDACALIHEGRLTYRARGLQLVLDLGDWWTKRRGLPLPLGGNAIRRGLGAEAIARASSMLRESIRYALAHRDQALDELCADRPELSRAQADQYLALYANDDTLDYGADGRRAIDVLLADAAEQNLLPRARVDWAP